MQSKPGVGIPASAGRVGVPALAGRISPTRAGLTLLEVLFSIFVMAIGVLSIASLIPVAKSLILDAGKSDRAVAAGQSALAEVKNRNMLRWVAGEWQDVAVGGVYDSLYDPAIDITIADSNLNGTFDAWPFGAVIDPLFLATNANGANAADSLTFPYIWPATGAGAGASYANYGANSGVTFMPRITPWPNWNGITGTLATDIELHRLLAERVFSAQDDLAFSIPDDDAARPLRTYTRGVDNGWGVQGTDDDGNGVTDDGSEAGWPGSDDTAQTTLDYSWIATVVPSDNEPNFVLGRPATVYTVSVAVFYKRKLVLDPTAAVPSERFLYADFVGSGLGGGDVRLRAIPGSNTTADWLNVRPNQWIMLAGWQATGDPVDPVSGNSMYTSTTLPEGTGKNRPIFRWYRVAGASSVEEDPTVGLIRYVTLAGPDWIPSGATGIRVDADGSDDGIGDAANNIDANDTDINAPTVTAFIFDDCVGVFEQVIRLETSPLWSD